MHFTLDVYLRLLLAWQSIYYAYQEGNMWDREFFHPMCSREQNFSGQMLTPGTVKEFGADSQGYWMGMWLYCKPSLHHLVHSGIWNIYHNYMNKWKDMQVNWNVCVPCFSAQWNSHLGISMSHISSTNQSKQQFTPWRVLHRKLDFIISELITLESFFQVFTPLVPPSLWIQNKATWKYTESTLIKIAFGTQCG